MNSTKESHAAKDGYATTGGGHPDIASPGSLPHSNVNVGETERIASAIGGAVLVVPGCATVRWPVRCSHLPAAASFIAQCPGDA